MRRVQIRDLADVCFREFLYTIQLVLPVMLEGCGPEVQRADGFCVGALELLAAVAAHSHQAHIAQHGHVGKEGMVKSSVAWSLRGAVARACAAVILRSDKDKCGGP